jgi:hypothetical protein
MQLTKIKDGLFSKVSEMKIFDQLIETIYVSEDKGILLTSNIYKYVDSVKTIEEKIHFNLKTYRLMVCSKDNGEYIYISDGVKCDTLKKDTDPCACISKDINMIFINEMKNFKNIKKLDYKYFKTNIIEKIFLKKTPNQLLEKINEVGKGCSWVIIPKQIFNIIRNLPEVECILSSSNSIINKCGKVSDLTIYLNPNENENICYFGNYDSISLLINKNLEIDSDNRKINIKYQFVERGLTRSLMVK